MKKRILCLIIAMAGILCACSSVNKASEAKNLQMVYGDVDQDGDVTANDALSVLKHVVKLESIKDERSRLFADMDADEEITAEDALGILKTVVKLIPQISYEETVMPADTPETNKGKELSTMDEFREGTSADTVSTPDDFPEVYEYGSGKMSDWNQGYASKRMPEPVGNQTVANTPADPTKFQALYLWEEGKAPAVTDFTENMTGYFDNWDFRPYVTAIPMRTGVVPKGAVVLMAGGAYQFRGNYTDALTTAAALREYGFQTFVVDYRLRPYMQEEGALDVARAVRFIRKNADIYGIDPDDIAVMGFSAGGIQAGEFLMNYDEDVNGTSLDPDYEPDALDEIPAHASADGMIYSFYGRLSVGNMDPDWLKEGNLPPTFYVYGTEDPFYRQFEQQYQVIKNMGIPVSRIVLDGWPHGFGSDGGWVKDYAAWLESVFALHDAGDEEASPDVNVPVGEWIRGNVLEGEEGEIHYSYYLPEGYDGTKKYPMIMTLPGYGGMWFGEESEGNHLREIGVSVWTQEKEPLIVVSPQVTDWHDTSARQTIELTEYFIENYAVDESRVYGAGYSAGGETMSRVMGMQPELFAAYLHGSSQWDGAYEPVAKSSTAVYIFMAEHDEYYGSQKARDAYEGLLAAYQDAGKTRKETEAYLHLWIPEDEYFNSRGITNYHGGGTILFEDASVRAWLLSKSRSK